MLFGSIMSFSLAVVSGNSLASSRRTYCEVQLVSSDGMAMGKPIRTRYCNKTSNPEWEQELILYVCHLARNASIGDCYDTKDVDRRSFGLF
jgi:hypothetical protein